MEYVYYWPEKLIGFWKVRVVVCVGVTVRVMDGSVEKWKWRWEVTAQCRKSRLIYLHGRLAGKLHCTDFNIGLEEICIPRSVVLVTVLKGRGDEFVIHTAFIYERACRDLLDRFFDENDLHSSKRGHTFLAHKPTAHCNIHTNLIYSFSKYIFTDGERRHSVSHTHSEWTIGTGEYVSIPWVSDYGRWWVYDRIPYQVK